MVEAVNKKVGSKHPDSFREAVGKTFLIQLGIVFLFVLSGFFAFANEEVTVDSTAVHP